jgi:cytochrome c oxidase subunit 1
MAADSMNAFKMFLQAPSILVGRLYLMTCGLFMLIAATAAVVIQFDMLTPVLQVTGALWFGKLLTGHGMLMIFLVVLPVFPGVFGQLVLPSAVGERQFVQSRLGLAGWLCHLIGGILVVVALLLGGYDSGWQMMMPVAGHTQPFVLLIIGLLLAALATLLPSIEIVRMVASRRVRSHSMAKLPIFAWFLLLGAIVQVVVTPVRLVTLLAVLGSHLWGWTYFSLTHPEGISLYQQFFWLYAGPATLSLLLFVVGLGFEVLVARSKVALHAHTALIVAGFGLLILSIASFPQHLIASGESELATVLGSLFGLLMTGCAGFILLHLLRQLVRIQRPYTGVDLFVFSTLFCGFLSGLEGAALAIPAIAIHLHNTYFTVAHLHVALVGVIGGAVFGGLFHFWPQWWQCILPAKSVRISAYTMLVGICLTFLPMVALGTLGLPRSLYEYPDNYKVLHAISSVGSFLLVASLLHAIAILALSARRRIPAIEGPQPIGGEFTYSNMNFQIEER